MLVLTTVPLLTYSIQIFATAAFGSHTALLGSPLNSAAGTAVSPKGAASHAELRSTGFRILGHSDKRICRQASKNGIARYRESPHQWAVRGSGASPMGAPWARYSSKRSYRAVPRTVSPFSDAKVNHRGDLIDCRRNCGLDKLVPGAKRHRITGTQKCGQHSLGMEHAHHIGPYPTSRMSPQAPRD